MCILAAMAVHTILRRVLEIIAGVAAATGHVGMCADQLERRLAVVERGWLPRRRRVTLGAVGAECAVMRVLATVAVHAVLRCTVEHAVGVASSAGHIDVRARQLERSAVVIEGHLFPIVGRVTLRAIGPELAGVRIVLAVAIYTVLRGALEHAVDVASSASHVDVRARQLERGSIVIKGGRLPALRRVTLRAVGAELAIVRVIFAMTS